MLKTLTLSLVFAAFAGATLAQEQPPANAEDCLKQAFQLAQAAEAKGLSDAKLDKIEELLTKMESHCDARQFPEATVVAKDIRSEIDAN